MDLDKDIENSEKGGGHSPSKEQQPACGFYRGALCPRCKQDILDYNGLLNLQCPHCGFENGYGFT